MTQEEIIQIPVSAELARRLRPYQRELPHILEWGLRHVEKESETASPLTPAQEDVLAALRSTGILVELDPAIAAKYRAGSDQQGRIPVRVKGKPLSEMIIEERDRQWTDSQ
jgi:hypothetical protein